MFLSQRLKEDNIIFYGMYKENGKKRSTNLEWLSFKSILCTKNKQTNKKPRDYLLHRGFMINRDNQVYIYGQHGSKPQIKAKAFQVSHLLLCTGQSGEDLRQPLNLNEVGVP